MFSLTVTTVQPFHSSDSIYGFACGWLGFERMYGNLLKNLFFCICLENENFLEQIFGLSDLSVVGTRSCTSFGQRVVRVALLLTSARWFQLAFRNPLLLCGFSLT